MLNRINLKYLRWSVVSALMKFRIAQAASVIPIAGYAILWSEKMEAALKLQSVIRDGAFFSLLERLYMIYFGSIFLTLALIIFWLACPRFIRRHPAIEDYILEQDQTVSASERAKLLENNRTLVFAADGKVGFQVIAGRILKSEMSAELIVDRSQPDRKTKDIYRINYLQNEDRYLPAIFLTLTFIAIGLVLFLAPSCEVFYLVLRSMLTPLSQ